MKTPWILPFLFLLTCYASSTTTDDPDSILGKWLLGNGEVCVEVVRVGSEYSAKIVWLKEPVYPKGHTLEGKSKIDRFNPDETKRTRPLLGLTVLSGLTYAGNNEWTGGTIYDADSGKTYRCHITLESSDRLSVRGYVGFRVLGRTITAYRNNSYFDGERKTERLADKSASETLGQQDAAIQINDFSLVPPKSSPKHGP